MFWLCTGGVGAENMAGINLSLNGVCHSGPRILHPYILMRFCHLFCNYYLFIIFNEIKDFILSSVAT